MKIIDCMSYRYMSYLVGNYYFSYRTDNQSGLDRIEIMMYINETIQYKLLFEDLLFDLENEKYKVHVMVEKYYIRRSEIKTIYDKIEESSYDYFMLVTLDMFKLINEDHEKLIKTKEIVQKKINPNQEFK
jgi:hypothetical protein